MSLVAISLVVFVIMAAVTTALFRDVLSAIIVFGAYSLGMAILYALLRAPDVAMTEAAISAGVTTILLLLGIARTTRGSQDQTFEPIDWKALAACGAFLIAMLTLLPHIPTVGDPQAPAWSNPDVTGYYISQTYADTGVQNAVTAVLAAYRGFDTFGEAVVVFAAGVAVLIVLNREVFTR